MLALSLLVTNFLTGQTDEDWIFANLVEAREIARANGYRQSLGHALLYRAAKRRIRGEGESVRAELEEAATILGEIGDQPCSLSARMQLIGVDAVTERRGQAKAQLPGLIRSAATISEAAFWVRAVDFACLVALEHGDLEVAARLLGISEQTPLERQRAVEVGSYRIRLEEAMTADDLARLTAEGGAMTVDEAVATVVSWAA